MENLTHENSYSKLAALIKVIENDYRIIKEKWKKSGGYKKINLSKKLVIDVIDSSRNPELLSVIYDYRDFLSETTVYLSVKLGEQGYDSRVKNPNSIQSKLDVYCHRKERGEIALKKCLNDLYGMRYIIPQDENISLIEIFKYLKENFSCYKCTDANKEIGYRAVHLYFSEDNFDFPWELQIWEAEDATNNIKLHKKYKQAYTAWEKQSKKEG